LAFSLFVLLFARTLNPLDFTFELALCEVCFAFILSINVFVVFYETN